MNLKKEAVNDGFDCVILHDVDMLLENGQNIYQCQDQPVQLCPFIDKVRDRRRSITYDISVSKTRTVHRGALSTESVES